MSAGLHRGGTNPITLLAAIGMVVCGVALPSIFYGSAMRETAERTRADQTAQENKALCERLGIVHGGNQLAACVEVLLEARRLEAKRVANDIAAIL